MKWSASAWQSAVRWHRPTDDLENSVIVTRTSWACGSRPSWY